MNRFLIKTNQILIHLLTARIQRFLFGFKRADYLKLEKNQKYIIVSNHMTFFDSHMLLAAMPFREYVKILPIKFITTHEFMDKPHWNVFLSLQGSVSTRPKGGEKLLKSLERQLRNKDTILVFPRGRLYKPGVKWPTKVGAVYLEKKVKGSKIIPVKISVSKWYSPSKMVMKLLTRKVKVDIKFKEIFRHEKFPKDLAKISESMMDEIEK